MTSNRAYFGYSRGAISIVQSKTVYSLAYSSVIPRLHDRANIEQTSS